LHRNDSRVERSVIGAVMAVASSAMRVMHDHIIAVQFQNVGDRIA